MTYVTHYAVCRTPPSHGTQKEKQDDAIPLSDRAGTAFTPHVLTEDAAGVIGALKLDRPRLLGFSMGAETAVRLAATYPALVCTVIVTGANDRAPQPQHLVNSPGYQAWYQSYSENDGFRSKTNC